jgi:uncharacterized protein YidB (DUF937 family)
MDLFGNLMNAVTGANSTPAADLGHPGMVNALLALLSAQGGQSAQGGAGGGLSGLVQMFEQQGLGHLAASWIGNGQNLPVSAQQIENVLGGDQLSALAQQAGVPPGEASSILASVLPGLVNQLTPTGSIEHGLLEEGISLLRGKMA